MFYEDFKIYWLPVLKKSYFELRIREDYKGIVELYKYLQSNWNLTDEQKKEIWKEVIGKREQKS